MTSLTEITSQAKYKKLMNLNYLDNTSDINKIFNISQISRLPALLDAKCQPTNPTFLDNLTLYSNLNISANTIFNNLNIRNLFLDQALNIQNANINNINLNNLTTQTSINILNAILNNLTTDTITSNSITLSGSNINIGTKDNIVNINNINYTNQYNIIDSLIYLNISQLFI